MTDFSVGGKRVTHVALSHYHPTGWLRFFFPEFRTGYSLSNTFFKRKRKDDSYRGKVLNFTGLWIVGVCVCVCVCVVITSREHCDDQRYTIK